MVDAKLSKTAEKTVDDSGTPSQARDPTPVTMSTKMGIVNSRNANPLTEYRSSLSTWRRCVFTRVDFLVGCYICGRLGFGCNNRMRLFMDFYWRTKAEVAQNALALIG